MIELLEDGETMPEAAARVVSEDLVSAYLDHVEWNPKTGELRVFDMAGAFYDFDGISRRKLDELVYSASPTGVLNKWLMEK